MPNIRAIAAAVHGRPDSLRFTTSVVEGESKDAITTRETWVDQLKPDSKLNVQEVFRTFVSRVDQVVQEQRHELAVTLPVVFGWPGQFASEELIKNVGRAFGISTKEQLQRGPSAKFVSEASLALKTARLSRFYMNVLRELFEKHMEGKFGLSEDDCKLHPRGFLDSEYTTPGFTIEAAEDRIRTTQNDEWDRAFSALVELARAGDAEARAALDELMQEEAARLAYKYRSIHLPEGDTRFFLTGLARPPFTEDLHANCFTVLPGLRDTFARELIRILTIQNNISLKAPVDAPSKPFTDVAATYIADTLDQLTGVHDPTAVLVQQRP